MGSKRIGLARMQALIENLKRELNLDGTSLKNGVMLGKRFQENVTTDAIAPKLTDSGTLYLMNRAGGIEITLPTFTEADAGWFIDIYVQTSFSGTFQINSGTATQLFMGGVDIVEAGSDTDANRVFFAPDESNDDQLVADANTKGRLKGGLIRIESVSATRTLITGRLLGAGGAVTPFI